MKKQKAAIPTERVLLGQGYRTPRRAVAGSPTCPQYPDVAKCLLLALSELKINKTAPIRFTIYVRM
jgi:hypothetical protein